MEARCKLKRRPSRYLARSFGRKKVKNRLDRIAFALEHSKFLEYVDDMQSPRFVILRQFIMGAAKGVGLTVGTALIIAIAIWVLQHLISMNIPFLTERLVDFVQFVKQAATSVPVPNGSAATSYVDTLSNTVDVK